MCDPFWDLEMHDIYVRLTGGKVNEMTDRQKPDDGTPGMGVPEKDRDKVLMLWKKQPANPLDETFIAEVQMPKTQERPTAFGLYYKDSPARLFIEDPDDRDRFIEQEEK